LTPAPQPASVPFVPPQFQSQCPWRLATKRTYMQWRIQMKGAVGAPPAPSWL